MEKIPKKTKKSERLVNNPTGDCCKCGKPGFHYKNIFIDGCYCNTCYFIEVVKVITPPTIIILGLVKIFI